MAKEKFGVAVDEEIVREVGCEDSEFAPVIQASEGTETCDITGGVANYSNSV